MKKTMTLTIKRRIKANNALKRYLDANMWYRRKIYNKFVEKYKEWDSMDKETRGKFDWNKTSKEIYQYELSSFDYKYYCMGIREKCQKDVFETVRKVIKKRMEGRSSELRFTSYDKYSGSFKVNNNKAINKPKTYPTSARCIILDDNHIQFRFNRTNTQIIEIKEHLKFEIDESDPRIMFKTFTGKRYRFQNKDIKEVVFVKEIDKYFINLIVEVEILDYNKQRNFLAGIDLGLRNPVTMCYLDDNDKEVIEKFNMSDKEHRRMKHLEERKARLQYIMNRKYKINKERVEKGELDTIYTNNYEKVRKKFRVTYSKICNLKRNWRQQTANYIINHYDNIVVDEFENPISNEETRKSSQLNNFNTELGMSYFMQDLRSMAKKYDCNFIDSPANTTRTCCVCGFVNKHLKLGKKNLKCEACGNIIDRDANASYNCFKYGLKEIL